ncbi:MAG: hypothetical protein HOQ22_08830 [Nocardioidaceae bacterium]|nr:hypothetical protein [Nocardioidaceae bacterium]
MHRAVALGGSGVKRRLANLRVSTQVSVVALCLFGMVKGTMEGAWAITVLCAAVNTFVLWTMWAAGE